METKRINEVPGLMHLWQVDNMLLAGQPQEESFQKLKEMGVTKVFNLRSEDEMDFNYEIEALKKLDIPYIQFPIIKDGNLIAENCLRLNSELNEKDIIMIHCGTANRVAGWLMTYLPLERGMSVDEAVEIAMNNGLTKPDFIEQAKTIVKANK